MNNEDLRSLCIKNSWFTSGSINQYEKLFERNDAGASYKELATIIWLCSSEVTVEEIIKELTKSINDTDVRENLYNSLDHLDADYIYRKEWSEHVKEDAENWAEINMDDEYPEDFMNGVYEKVGQRYAFEGDYDCTLCYWDNIQNLVKDELSLYEGEKS